jgi:HNH endonuclease
LATAFGSSDMRSIDVPAGTVFGRLTVIKETRTGSRNIRAMICLCACGAEKIVQLTHLTTGHTTSCGCLRLTLIAPGTVFGRLAAVVPALTPNGRSAMLCECECGKQKIVQVAKLLSGHVKSCGCLLRPEIDLARLGPGEVPLYGKKAAGRVARVDAGDFDLVMQYRWHIGEQKNIPGQLPHVAYAKTNAGGGLRMHNLITGWLFVDHIDHNGLNNRRSNLREATKAQNAANERKRPGCSSRYKGVIWQANRWAARIEVGDEKRYLGRFISEEAAARAYDAAAREGFGEFACLNFPG